MTGDSISIWLDPHIVTARVEIWDKSYGLDLYIGNFIKPGWSGGDPKDDPYYLPGDPFPAGRVYTVKFPEQVVDGFLYEATELGFDFVIRKDHVYTIPIAVGGTPSAKTVEINLPDELDLGVNITGYIKIKNIGNIRGLIRCLITTEWNNTNYKTEQELDPSQILKSTLPAGVVMPTQDAIITIRAQHYNTSLGEWETDEVVTH